MWTYNHRQWDTAERRQSGLVIVLPGIDGLSWCTRGVVRGLAEAGVPYALEIHDWTFGPLWAIRNLRDSRRHQAHAAILCEKIAGHQAAHPGTPTFFIGHSAGAAMTLLTLERLDTSLSIDAGVLLAPAVSPGFDVTPALARARLGIWNFHAWRDLVFLGLLTTVCGTVDGRHRPAAGLLGFRSSAAADDSAGPKLHQVPWQWSMLKHRNLAGHFGCVNYVFVRHWVAPILSKAPVDVTASGIGRY